MLLVCSALVALLWQTPAGSATDSLSVKGNEIWLQTASGKRQLTHDGASKRLPTLSPPRDALVYVEDHPVPGNAPEETLVVLGLNGEIRRRIVPEGYVPAAFWRLDWLDDQRIGAMSCGHANCMYWVMNPQSGKTVQLMQGGFDFIWSHDRQFVVRLWAVNGDEWDDDCSPEYDAVLFNQDDVFAYPPEKLSKHLDKRRTHNIGIGADPRFVWSPDDKWVAFTDLIGPEGDWHVVILSPDGKMLRDTVSIDPDYDSCLEWLDNSHLDLRTGKGVFHFAINDGKLSEITPAQP